MSRPRDFLGPYRLVRLIRVGHTCEVWEAAKTDDTTRYVLKILRKDLRKNKEEVAALRNEYECGKSLKHKNIIRIYDFNTEGEATYVVMEYFEHDNLKLWLRNGTQRVAHLTLKIIEQSAEALFYFHSEGWVHRDVKPDNFLVSSDGVVKLIDFAISTRQKSGLSAMFSFGRKAVQGTRSYMSPEQIRGDFLDGRADIYSYGATLYELVTYRPPFRAASQQELLQKHILEKPIPPMSLCEDLTQEFNDLVMKCLAKKRDDRPHSFHDVLKALNQLRVYKNDPARKP